MNINWKNLAIPVGVLALYLTNSASANTQNDNILDGDTVRSMDIAPVLGRGYSVETGTLQSTCVDVNETHVPSYNFAYNFYDFTETTSYDESSTSTDPSTAMGLASTMTSTFAYHTVVEKLKDKRSSSGKVSLKTHLVVGTMRVERFYSTIEEHKSALIPEAKELLTKGDFVGFFKACGPNYIRTIRRAQEVTAIFSFQSTSTALARQFAAELKVKSSDGTPSKVKLSSKSKYSSILSTLEIDILAYGLGLDQKGTGTLVANSLEDYSDTMNFAFDAMTKNEDYTIGMVYTIVIKPWVENPLFTGAVGTSGSGSTSLKLPAVRNTLSRAVRSVDNTAYQVNDSRSDLVCSDTSKTMDSDFYCCLSDSLYNPITGEYNSDNPEYRQCRVLEDTTTTVASAAMATMAGNAEYVIQLDQAVRHKLHQLATLGRCVNSVHSIPDRYDFNILQPQSSAEYDATLKSFTVFELKRTVDPLGDYSMVKHLSKELDEFMDMFYSECLASLNGKDIYGSDFGGSVPEYFMAKMHSDVPTCQNLECLEEGQRWKRSGDGCHASLLTGTEAPEYGTDVAHCTKDDPAGACKYTTTDLNNHRTKVQDCWTASLPSHHTKIYHLMEQFCAPTKTSYQVSSDRQDILDDFKPSATGSVCAPPTSRRRLRRGSGRNLMKWIENDFDMSHDVDIGTNLRKWIENNYKKDDKVIN